SLRTQNAPLPATVGAMPAAESPHALLADLRQLTAPRGVHISIDATQVPCFPDVSVETALSSGEEYELVVTSPVTLDAVEFAHRFSLDLTEIGRVVPGPADVDVKGARVAALSGHDHFSSSCEVSSSTSWPWLCRPCLTPWL